MENKNPVTVFCDGKPIGQFDSIEITCPQQDFKGIESGCRPVNFDGMKIRATGPLRLETAPLWMLSDPAPPSSN